MAVEEMTRKKRADFQRDQRRVKIMAGAMKEAERVGYGNITRREVAAAAGVSVGSVNHEFGTMDALKEAVMGEAVASEQLDIIAQGIAGGHRAALRAPPALKEAAIRTIGAMRLTG